MKELNCKNCKPPKRNSTCHSTCQEYLEWQEEYQQEQKEIRRKKYLANVGKY